MVAGMKMIMVNKNKVFFKPVGVPDSKHSDPPSKY